MLFRLRALYLRYAADHLDRARGISLPRCGLRRSGRVEAINHRNGTVTITGWTRMRVLYLSGPQGQLRVTPDINRLDVAKRLKAPLRSGFSVKLPIEAFPLRLSVEPESSKIRSVNLADPTAAASARMRRRLVFAFLRDLARALAPGLRWLLLRSDVDRAGVKRRLGLGEAPPDLQIDAAYLGAPSTQRAQQAITIILPVHDAYDMVTQCLARVAAHTDLPWHLILIEDGSHDARIRPWLRSWAEGHPDQVSLIENDVAQGFVGAVNQALTFALRRKAHLVLLNSDAFLPAGWASRLLAPIEADPSIGSVTPLSNNAEIFSVPLMCRETKLAAGVGDALDRVAQRLSLPQDLASAPTGVGFCMAMSIDWLRRVPQFDPSFGPGYGEEVDWCQKVRALGGRHVGLPTLFVEHRGGQSFGADAKQKGIARAQAILARRYPGYDLEVQTYITQDPLRTARLALAVALAGLTSDDPIPLFVGHSLGGGAELALKREVAGYTRQGKKTLVLRVGGKARWRLELHDERGTLSASGDDLGAIRKLLAPLPRLRIIYSCAVGDADPITLPEAILSLRRPDRDDRIEARLHDYFVISPSYCLLQPDGRYHGVSPQHLAASAQGYRRPDGAPISIREWHLAWHRLLVEAQTITAFSASSRHIFEQVYPTLVGRIELRPHRPTAAIARVDRGRGAPPVLGVLGDINRQKGAEILADLAEQTARVRGPKLAIIGNFDARLPFPRGARLHGSYNPAEITALTKRYGVTAWLSPSVWPETFSFATHEMLATGLPVIGFDLGGQGDALRAAPNGHPIPYDPNADLARALFDAWAGRDKRMTAAPSFKPQPVLAT